MSIRSLFVLLVSLCGANLCFAQPESQIYLRDEFDGGYSLRWDIRNQNPAKLSFKQNAGCLTLNSQPGSIWRTNTSGVKNLHLIPNPSARGGDFVCTMHVKDFQPSARYHQTGIIFYRDDDNYLKCMAEHNDLVDGAHRFNLLAETDAKIVREIDNRELLLADKPFWLRVVKQGRTYIGQLSLDGTEFKTIGSADWGLGSPPWIGFLAKNVAAQREVAVQIESFEISSANVVKELGEQEEANGLVAHCGDEFDEGYALRWKVTGPDAKSVSLEQEPGCLSLHTQHGTMVGKESSPIKNFFLTQNSIAKSKDFCCTLRVNDLEESQVEHQVGVVLYDDEDNYVKVDVAFQGSEKGRIVLINEKDGKAEVNDASVKLKTPFWVRAAKAGKTYSAELSFDGVEFESFAECQRDDQPDFIGFVAASSSPESTAKVTIDSFELVSKPEAK